jgi:putative membrane protein
MRYVIALPVLLLLVLFALSNTQPVRLGLWPTWYALEVPLSAAMLIGMAVAFLIGAMLVWFSELAQRRRARRAEQTARALEEQVQELRARLSRTAALPPAA